MNPIAGSANSSLKEKGMINYLRSILNSRSMRSILEEFFCLSYSFASQSFEIVNRWILKNLKFCPFWSGYFQGAILWRTVVRALLLKIIYSNSSPSGSFYLKDFELNLAGFEGSHSTITFETLS